uniref:Uncharacterized protein n=1 Tax=Rhizophora mucronata TaxID=61149 RepID=A0A2P2PTF6_RHIMU
MLRPSTAPNQPEHPPKTQIKLVILQGRTLSTKRHSLANKHILVNEETAG